MFYWLLWWWSWRWWWYCMTVILGSFVIFCQIRCYPWRRRRGGWGRHQVVRLASPQTWKLDRPRDRGAEGWLFYPADQSQVSPFSSITHCPGMARRLGPSGGRREHSITTHVLLAFLSWRGEGSPLDSVTMAMASWGHLWLRPSEENERLQASTSQMRIAEIWSSLRCPLSRHCNSPISLEMRREVIGPLYSTMNSFWSVCNLLIWSENTRLVASILIEATNLVLKFFVFRYCCHHTWCINRLSASQTLPGYMICKVPHHPMGFLWI